MDNGENVIHIIGGDEGDNSDHKSIATTGYEYGVGSGGNAVAKMFFKTEMCRNVLSGRTCPNDSNCRFAHSIEELRIPEPNYQEFDRADEDYDRTYKIRLCKRFYSESGCSLGDKCSFRHDELIKGRESTTIVLGRGYGVPPEATLPPLAPRPPVLGPPPPLAPLPSPKPISPLTLKPMNWRTRICKKWEYSGFCPFGSSCIFAHGEGELQHFGGGLVNPDANTNKQGPVYPHVIVGAGSPAAHVVAGASSPVAHVVAGAGSPAAHIVAGAGSSVAHVGSSEQPSGGAKRPWKGPNKISLIYGDWIEDLE